MSKLTAQLYNHLSMQLLVFKTEFIYIKNDMLGFSPESNQFIKIIYRFGRSNKRYRG